MCSPSRLRRIVLLATVAAPLLSVGSCSRIAQTSVLNGLFNNLNPLLIDYTRQQLGLPTQSGNTDGVGTSTEKGSGE